ncbi:MAG: hypothetical protein RL112_2369, partial [Planctomycetota bacterium]
MTAASRRWRPPAWAWCVAAMLVATPFLAPRPDDGRGLAALVLGPLARRAAQAQWVLVDAAVRDGRMGLALRRAETALALDPTDASGWLYWGHHLAFERGSLERTPDAGERVAWLKGALAFLESGRGRVEDPSQLTLRQAAIWVALAQEPELWPGLPPGEAWSKAAE